MAPSFSVDDWRNVYRCFLTRKVGRFTKYRILIGAMFLSLPNAVPWYLGNILPYAYSYFRCKLDSVGVYDKIVWVLPIFLIMGTISIGTLDALRRVASPRAILALNIVSHDIGIFFTYFSVRSTSWGMESTLSIFTGFGHGGLLGMAYAFASQWFKDNIGTATSAIASTAGLGAIVCTAITTAFLNPNNLKPDAQDEKFYYFSDKDIIDRFPTLFLFLGVFTSVCHILAFYLLDVAVIHSGRPLPRQDAEAVGSNTSAVDTKSSPITEKSALDVRGKATLYTSEQHTRGSETHAANSCLSISFDIESPWIKKDDIENGKDEVTHGNNTSSSLSSSSSSSYSTDKGPFEILRSELFYYIWFGSLSMTIAFVSVSSNYKLFGLLWIHDDEFFAVVATIANVATVVCRMCVGILLDKLGVFNAIAAMMATNTVGMAFWYFTPRLDRWLYLAWTSFLIGLQSSTYTAFPVAVLKKFGGKFYSTNTGLIFLSIAVGSLITPPLTSALVTSVGWFWLFIFGSAPCLVAVVLILVRISVLKPDV